MKRISLSTGLLSILLLSFGAALPAQSGARILNVGDKAPALSIQKWLKGNPVSGFAKGHVYVIEFSSVNCPPCRVIAPHLTALSKQYAGKATFVGIHIWENSESNPKDLSYVQHVNNYLASMGSKIGFNVAVDVPRQTTATAWMKAAQKGGVPTVFIVDQAGKIAWIGSPFASMDTVVAQVVAGTFDNNAYLAQQQMLAEKQQKAQLKAGDVAPELKVSEWLKGKPVSSLQPRVQDGVYKQGQAYVIAVSKERLYPEDRKAIHELTRLAKKYDGQASVIMVYSEADTNRQQVIDFVDELGDKIGFTVALDTAGLATYAKWVKAAGRAYTTYFVVDGSGHIVWVTEQPVGIEPVLKEAIAGNGIATGIQAREKRASFNEAADNAFTLLKDGNYDNGFRLLDSLIKANPEAQYLYREKYRQLVHGPGDNADDEAKSGAFLRWMLDNLPEHSVIWEDIWEIAVEAVQAPEHRFRYPNLAVDVIDRAIKETEIAAAAAWLIRSKADFYASPTGKNDVTQAIAIIEQAMKQPNIIKYAGKQPAFTEGQLTGLEADLYKYRFHLLAGSDDSRANVILQEALAGSEILMDWNSLIAYALKAQKSPDYTLLLKAAERSVQAAASAPEAERPYRSAAAMAVKADVYAAQGETSKALDAYQQAVDISKSTGIEQIVTTYSDKLAAFKKKVNRN